jgi:hypothetical protein
VKTHEIANALTVLARILKAGPNVEIVDFSMPNATSQNDHETRKDPATIALSVSTLAMLSKISKGEWKALFSEWRLPVEIKVSDSVRDVMGRLFNYLDAHPEACRKLRQGAEKKTSKVSTELMDALSSLLGGEDEEKKK